MVEFYSNLHPIVQGILKGLAVIMVIFPIGGACSMAERKVSAWIQGRPGPSRAIVPWARWIPIIGPFLQRLGIFHVMADGGKMLFKEDALPGHVNKFYFVLAPIIAMIPALTTVTAVPFGAYINEAGRVIPIALANVDIGIIAVFAVSSLGVYSLILAGWASNSKYPFLAALRSAAQMVSYEVSIGFVIITVLLCAGSLNLTKIVEAQDGPWGLFQWYWLPLLPMFVIFFVSALAETNRPPFDLVEAESELVAGFAVEYSSTAFLLFFLGEYVAILTMCAMATILFLGGWLPPVNVVPFTWVPGVVWFTLKCLFIFFLFAMAKAIVPRYRYDQLMRLGWKVFLPLSLAMVAIVAAVLQFGGLAPK